MILHKFISQKYSQNYIGILKVYQEKICKHLQINGPMFCFPKRPLTHLRWILNLQLGLQNQTLVEIMSFATTLVVCTINMQLVVYKMEMCHKKS